MGKTKCIDYFQFTVQRLAYFPTYGDVHISIILFLFIFQFVFQFVFQFKKIFYDF